VNPDLLLENLNKRLYFLRKLVLEHRPHGHVP
jgi:hypothetical protein